MIGSELGLQFRLFGIPVQVSLFFLLIAVLLGQGATRGSPVLVVAWVAVVFVSVLLHELGHALTARAFGQQPYILLYGLGGVTSWRQRGEMTAGRRLLASVAGPGVGIVVGILALPVYAVSPEGAVKTVLSYVVFANLGWGILNLIPMLPLDGGNIVAAVFDLIVPGRGRRIALYLSIVVAVVVAPLAVAGGMFMLVLYCALCIWTNVQELRARAADPAPAPAAQVIDVPSEVLPPDVPRRPSDPTA